MKKDRERSASIPYGLRIPRQMREHLRQLLLEDGRDLAEFTRSLYADAIRAWKGRFREKAATA